MAQKIKPAHEIRFGAVRATIWPNRSSSGEDWYNVVTTRTYKNEQGQWQDTHSFKSQHLPDLMRVIRAADQWIKEHAISPEGRELLRTLVSSIEQKQSKTEGGRHE